MRIALCLLITLVGTAYADEPVKPPFPEAGSFLPTRLARLTLGIGSGVGWVRDRVANEQHFSGSGPTFEMSLGLQIKDVFAITASGGGLFPTDDNSFSETVVPVGGGSPRSVDSNLQIGHFSIAAGLRTPFLVLSPDDRIAGAAFADVGVSAISATRSVKDCVDCHYDDIDISGGTFMRVGLEIGAPGIWRHSGVGGRVAYERYFGDSGISQEIQVGMILWIP